jgi:hypothetical protein
MTIDILEKADWINDLENFLEKVRPEEKIRDKLDIGYKIENQTIIIHEIRPKWNNPKETIEPEIAKTTLIKSKNHWKVFWLRGNLKWYNYEPKPIVKNLNEFFELITEDKYGCFWG